MFDFEFIAGKAFTQQDEENNIAAPVIVISDNVARQLFATVDAVGKEVKIQNI
ncbi:MAG: ABC transporter permease, partial [Bacteroidaceae bacterium]|nr:ABC transporter permease [Bacteroidaceae bacterium]